MGLIKTVNHYERWIELARNVVKFTASVNTMINQTDQKKIEDNFLTARGKTLC